MPTKTVTTAGTRVALSAITLTAARVTLQKLSANGGTIYVGFPANGVNVGVAVSSTVYDCYLDATNPSVTFGMGQTNGNPVDLTKLYLDSSVNGEGVAFFVEPI